MNYTHGVAISCLSGNTGERVSLIVAVRAFSLPYSISTNRFGESLRPRLTCFHACLFSSTHFTIKPKISDRPREGRGEEGDGGEEKIPLIK